MFDRKLSRRALLMGSVGVSAFAAQPAAAMNELPLKSDTMLNFAYQNRCMDASGAHDQLLAELQTSLAQQKGAKGQTLTQTSICPLCGCPITATRTIP